MTDFISPSGPAPAATITTFRVAADVGPLENGSVAPKSRMGGPVAPVVNGGGVQPSLVGTIPLSARKAAPLDLATVERRGQGPPAHHSKRPNRMFGLQEAPEYRPTPEQFRDPVEYISSIKDEAQKFGIVKIIPPEGWNPPFTVDTEVSAIAIYDTRYMIILLTCTTSLNCH